MSLPTVLFLWAALTAATAPAAAAGDPGKATEVRHEVSFALTAPDVALFTVTRTYATAASDRGGGLDHQLALPDLAVVTSFAIRTGGPWRQGRLERQGGRARPRGDRRQPWARLDGGDYRAAHVLTAPLPAGETQLRYTVWAQAEPRPGGRRWSYCGGDSWNNAGPLPEISLPAGHPELSVRRDEESDGCLIVDKSEPDGRTPVARFGAYALNAGAWWWRLELAVPARVADVPRPDPAAPIVFVLDASRSQKSLGPQLELVRAMLANTPSAEAEVLLVSRTVDRVVGRFVPAVEMARAIPEGMAKGPLHNGSFLDRGAALAAELLRETGKPGRIVLFTDGVLRARFSQPATLASLRKAPAGTIAHLIYPVAWDSDPEITHRVPEGLDMLASALGGGAYNVLVSHKSGAFVAPQPDALRRLLRPAGLESLELTAKSGPADWPPDADFDASGTIDAGATRIWSGVSRTRPPSGLTFTAWVWGRKLRIPARRDPVFERRLPRLVTSADGVLECEDRTRQAKDALAAGFLAPGLLFRVPGGGAEEEDVAYGTVGTCGRTVSGGSNCSGGKAPPADITPILEAALNRCGVTVDRAGKVRARIETHREEILDVAIDGGDERTRTCLDEELWNLSLPAGFDSFRYGRVDRTLTFAPRPAQTAPIAPR